MDIDINSDLGESFGNYKIGNDSEVLKYISSANIACGFHAGDPLVIENTIKMALENNVSVGAHPGYPDIVGFGRRHLNISDKELHALILYQVSALKTMTEALGGKLKHVKPHGALYNDLANNFHKTEVFAKAIYKIDPELVFVGLANSEMIEAAKKIGLRTANETFADRAYNNDGTLVSRNQKGAVLHDTDQCLKQIHQIITQKSVQSIYGKTIKLKADTICVHGDNPQALNFVKGLNIFLHDNNINRKSF